MEEFGYVGNRHDFVVVVLLVFFSFLYILSKKYIHRIESVGSRKSISRFEYN